MVGGRKDAFPGADGSTIQQSGIPNAETITIYGADGSVLTEGSKTGLRLEDITTSGVLLENISLVYAVKNPLAIIYNATNPWDWYTNVLLYQNNLFWGYSQVQKGVQDPCPQGWHIATDDAWKDFTTTNAPSYIIGETNPSTSADVTKGRLYNQIAWFPSCGRREYSTGKLVSSGQNGYYWTKKISGSSALGFYFSASILNASTTYGRALGFSVRCIQE